jgi:hypothetical protein
MISILGDQYIPIARSFDKTRFVRVGKLIFQAGSAGLFATAAGPKTFVQFVSPQAALGQLLGAMQERGFDEAGIDLPVRHPGSSLPQLAHWVASHRAAL